MKEIRNTYILFTDEEENAIIKASEIADKLTLCENEQMINIGIRLESALDELKDVYVCDYQDGSYDDYEIVNDFNVQFDPFEETEINVE